MKGECYLAVDYIQSPVNASITGLFIWPAERDSTFTRNYKKMRMSMEKRSIRPI